MGSSATTIPPLHQNGLFSSVLVLANCITIHTHALDPRMVLGSSFCFPSRVRVTTSFLTLLPEPVSAFLISTVVTVDSAALISHLSHCLRWPTRPSMLRSWCHLFTLLFPYFFSPHLCSEPFELLSVSSLSHSHICFGPLHRSSPLPRTRLLPLSHTSVIFHHLIGLHISFLGKTFPDLG